MCRQVGRPITVIVILGIKWLRAWILLGEIVVVHRHRRCRNEIDVRKKTVLFHGYSLTSNVLRIMENKQLFKSVWFYLCNSASQIVSTIDKANTVDPFFFSILSAVVHEVREAGCFSVSQVFPYCSISNLCDSKDFFSKKLKNYFEVDAKAVEIQVKTKYLRLFGNYKASRSLATVPVRDIYFVIFVSQCNNKTNLRELSLQILECDIKIFKNENCSEVKWDTLKQMRPFTLVVSEARAVGWSSKRIFILPWNTTLAAHVERGSVVKAFQRSILWFSRCCLNSSYAISWWTSFFLGAGRTFLLFPFVFGYSIWETSVYISHLLISIPWHPPEWSIVRGIWRVRLSLLPAWAVWAKSWRAVHRYIWVKPSAWQNSKTVSDYILTIVD